MKTIQDVKKEYGYILRWINTEVVDGVEYKGWYFLENVKEYHDTIKIENTEAIKFIDEKRKVGKPFRNDCHVYDNYVKLFEILGIEKLENPNKHISLIRLLDIFNGNDLIQVYEDNGNILYTGSVKAVETDAIDKKMKDLNKLEVVSMQWEEYPEEEQFPMGYAIKVQPIDIDLDLFYSKENMTYLSRIAEEIKTGKAKLQEHDL